jgi:FkbM family methyltransferase
MEMRGISLFKYLHRDGDPEMSLLEKIKRQISEWRSEKRMAKSIYNKRDCRILSKWLGVFHRGMFISPIISRKRIKFNININNFDLTLEIRKNQSDLYILRENFIQLIYNYDYEKHIQNPSHIVDLGANMGLSSLYFQSRFNNAKIVCVEPVQENVDMIIRNMQNNNFNWSIEKAAIQSNGGTVQLYPNEWWSSCTVVEDVANKRQMNRERFEYHLKLNPVKVEAVPVDVILDRNNIEIVDILKMDIEGAEEDTILNSPKWLNRVKILIIEIHDKYVNREKITNVLLKNNYHRVIGRTGPTDVFINRNLV